MSGAGWCVRAPVGARQSDLFELWGFEDVRALRLLSEAALGLFPGGLPPRLEMDPGRRSLADRVLACLMDGRWWSARALRLRIGGGHETASLTARVRDLRKRGYDIGTDIVRHPNGTRTYRYRLYGKEGANVGS